jgi:hypothetical protein
MPATVNVGELMLLKVSTGGEPVIIMPAGWENAYTPVVFTSVSIACFKKIADGTEGGTTVNFTTEDSGGSPLLVKSSHIACAITGWVGDLAGVVAAPAAFEASTANPNPPSVTATWAGGDNLFLAQMSMHRTAAITGYPTNYTTNQTEISTGSAGQDSIVAMATRALAANSDDPDTFSAAIARRSIAQTLVIAPVGAVLPKGIPKRSIPNSMVGAFAGSIIN